MRQIAKLPVIISAPSHHTEESVSDRMYLSLGKSFFSLLLGEGVSEAD